MQVPARPQREERGETLLAAEQRRTVVAERGVEQEAGVVGVCGVCEVPGQAADALAFLRGGGGSGGRAGTEAGVDLAFLDIQMPGLGGIELARAVGAAGGDTRVVFTTAFPGYALEGFRVDALDYLLKPISFEEFTQAVGRATAWFGRSSADRDSTDRDSADRDSADRPETPQTVIVKSGYKQFVIALGSIVYIEAIRDYIRIHTVDEAGRAGSVQTLMNLKAVEEMLPADRFARTHRSYIVALDRVVRLGRAHVILDGAATDGTAITIPVSDTYKSTFLKLLAARAL